jgi:hypothetical protein
MPPPELWGPATWTLFHVLAEKVNEHIYPRIVGQLFDVIKKICSALPCPECAQDATQFLAKVKVHELKSKADFKNMIYVFHNYVNNKKRKPLFKYNNLDIYKNYHIVSVFNRFISFYHTKGNMRLLAESFQRQLIVRNVREWFSRNICFFIPCQQNVNNIQEPVYVPNTVPTVSEEEPTVEVAEEPTVESVEPTVESVEVVVEPTVESVIEEEPTVESVEVVEEPLVGISSEEIIEPTVPTASVKSEEVVVESEATALPTASEATVEEEVADPSVPTVIEATVEEEELVEPSVPTEESVVESEATVSEATVSEATVKPKRGRKKKVV